MKVCFIGESFSFFSGTSRPILELACGLSGKGIDVTIISSHPPESLGNAHKYLLEHNYNNVKIIEIPDLLKLLLFKKNPETLNELKKSLLEQDIIHGIDFLTLHGIRTLLGESKGNIRLICSTTGTYRLYPSELYHAGMPVLLNMIKPHFIFKLLCPYIFYRKILNNFDKVIPTSDFMVNDLRAHGVSMEKIEKLPVGLATNFVNDDENKIKDDFLYFGWGSSIRGVPDVLNAFDRVLKKNPDVRLNLSFLGTHGIEERMYINAVKKSDNYKSIELNVGPRLNMYEVIKASNAVVLPFRSTFGYSHPPLTILESMLLKKVVISTTIGSIPELITDGTTGLLVPPKDNKALAQKMLLACDKDLTNNIGKQASEFVRKQHNINDVSERAIQIYNRAIGGD